MKKIKKAPRSVFVKKQGIVIGFEPAPKNGLFMWDRPDLNMGKILKKLFKK